VGWAALASGGGSRQQQWAGQLWPAAAAADSNSMTGAMKHSAAAEAKRQQWQGTRSQRARACPYPLSKWLAIQDRESGVCQRTQRTVNEQAGSNRLT